MREMIEHPEITWIERTGYPSWAQPTDDDEGGVDFDYEAEDDYEQQTAAPSGKT